MLAGTAGTAAAAAALFAGTNVDDMVVLAVLSGSSRATGRPRRWEIWAERQETEQPDPVVRDQRQAAGRGH